MVKPALTQNHRFVLMRSYMRRFYVGLFLLFLIMTAGISGYILIEGYTLNEAFYMTIITMSTVGFSEVRHLSDTGRIFTSFLIIFNLGIFAYAISLISAFLVEGEFRKLLKYYNMYNKISQLEGHVIVCGFGKHGEAIVKELLESKLDFVILENDPAKLNLLEKEKPLMYLEGDATNDEILQQAGVGKAMALIVTLPDETENLYVVLSAREMNPNLKIISRTLNAKAERKLKKAGANHVIMPYRISGLYMARLVNSPEGVEFFNILSQMDDKKFNFEEIACSEFKPKFLNKSILELDLRRKTGINVIGLKQKDGTYTINPSPDLVLTEEMILIVLGNPKQIEKFYRDILN